jgi:MarR family transcriptional regulator, organic hydroperoxide resistance regulator
VAPHPKKKKAPARRKGDAAEGAPALRPRFYYTPEESVGHQVRWAHRALQRELEEHLRPYGITLGMWYFLRVLWEKDGQTQRELSDAVGTSEPTTVTALHAMEKRGLAVRIQNSADRRKSNIFLTKPARDLRDLLLREAREVNRIATAGISAAEIDRLITTLGKIRNNLAISADARRRSSSLPSEAREN